MRGLLVVGVLALCFGCSRSRPKDGSAGVEAPSLRIALVTDLQGYLEPCGCTSDPLGGIDRLAAQIRALRDGSAPVVFVIAGDVFFDTDELEPARVDQANRNAKTLVRILNRLGVTVILPGERDRAQPAAHLDALRAASDFPWLAMQSEIEALEADAGPLRLAVIGVHSGADRDAVATVVNAARTDTDLTLALIVGSRRDASRVGAIDGVDFVIEGGLDENEPIPPREAGKAWAFYAGRQGRGVTVVDVYRRNTETPFVDQSEWSRSERAAQLDERIDALSSKITAWERSGDVDPDDLRVQRGRLADLESARRALDAPPKKTTRNAFSARWVALSKKAPKDAQVEKLMREHDEIVNEANRVAFANLRPPPLGPGDVAYVGSAACAGCHQAAYAWWSTHPHGHAYLTLEQLNKEYNLDCVGCHVTGYGQPGGSTVTHNLNGALVHVGCESCHGPGAAHAKNPEVGILRDTPESICVTCHNAQHSDLFDYSTYLKAIVVPGHGLPQAEP